MANGQAGVFSHPFFFSVIFGYLYLIFEIQYMWDFAN